MAFLFGRGSKASKSTTPYMGAELGSAQSPMHSGYVKGYGLGEAMGSGRKSRLPGEMTSARQYQDVPISQRGSVSRGMSPGQTRSLLAQRGQLRGLEGRGTRPMSGTRSTGRMPKTNLGGRPVSTGYGSLVNNRQAEAMADFSRSNAAAIPKARVTGTASRSQSVSRGGLPGAAPSNINLGNMGQVNRNPFNTFGGRTSGTAPVSPIGSGGDMPSRTGAPPVTNARSTGGRMGGKGLRNMSSRNKLMIGAGALVLGAAAYSGRRGDGTSSGRSGMTRY